MPGEPGASARRVETMVARQGPALLRVANQFSLCHDDALDAYQRALEIYLRRLDSVDVATEGAWLRVVVLRTFVPSRPKPDYGLARGLAQHGRSDARRRRQRRQAASTRSAAPTTSSCSQTR